MNTLIFFCDDRFPTLFQPPKRKPNKAPFFFEVILSNVQFSRGVLVLVVSTDFQIISGCLSRREILFEGHRKSFGFFISRVNLIGPTERYMLLSRSFHRHYLTILSNHSRYGATQFGRLLPGFLQGAFKQCSIPQRCTGGINRFPDHIREFITERNHARWT